MYWDDRVTAFVCAGWWPNNRGHVLVVPNEHFENVYDLPPELATPIQRVTREVAIAFREAYEGCEGVSTRNHNEPAGMQDVWHYHAHVFPRYPGDELYLHRRRPSSPEERHPYAARLREWFTSRAEVRQ